VNIALHATTVDLGVHDVLLLQVIFVMSEWLRQQMGLEHL
jgi:hypothetical protein